MSSSRWRYAVLVTTLSIALAEVSIGSSPWGLLLPLQWILMVPIYGAQPLLIAWIVLRRNGRPTLPTLWCAGVVMGLYEFYITGVFWDQPWDAAPSTGVVEWGELIVIGGFWHAFMAVILPLMIADRVMVREPTLASALPARVRSLGGRAPWVLLVVWAWISGEFYARDASVLALAALGGTMLAVWGIVSWARRRPVDVIAEALPTRRGAVGLAALVVALFIPFVVGAQTTGMVLRQDVFLEPVWWQRQVAVVALYALFVGMAARNMRHRQKASEVRLRLVPVGWVPAVVFLVVATAASLASPAPLVGLLVVWGAGGGVALTMFIRAVRGAARETSPRERDPDGARQ